MNYPGHIVQHGDPDAAVAAAIQGKLKTLGYGPFVGAAFDDRMASVVRLFQSQHVDREGRPLDADGIVGPLTWAAIFGATTSPAKIVTAPSALAQKAVDVAKGEKGAMEQPPGSNRGSHVDQYLSSVGIPPNYGTAEQRYWCMAFAYFCVDTAAQSLHVANPLYKTAGVLEQWDKCAGRPGVRRITRQEAMIDLSLVQPGQLLILDHGHGLGHTGIVVAVDGPHLTVVEGNASGQPNDRNGVGVFETDFRAVTDGIVKGLISYGA
jgi:hypothetical protein